MKHAFWLSSQVLNQDGGAGTPGGAAAPPARPCPALPSAARPRARDTGFQESQVNAYSV